VEKLHSEEFLNSTLHIMFLGLLKEKQKFSGNERNKTFRLGKYIGFYWVKIGSDAGL
jgi:hypothetical protein